MCGWISFFVQIFSVKKNRSEKIIFQKMADFWDILTIKFSFSVCRRAESKVQI